MTRYLKPVYAADLVSMGDFPRWQKLGIRPRKVTRGLAGEQLVPALSQPGTCACDYRTPGRRWQAVPERRAAPRPEHRKRRRSSAVPARGNRYGKQRSWVRT